MKYQGKKPQLAPLPFTGMLSVVDAEAKSAEITCALAVKNGDAEPEYAVRKAKMMRAIERLLVGIEGYWDKPPPGALSVKQMMAKTEQLKAVKPEFVDPQAGRGAPAEKLSDTLEGDDDD